MYDYWSSSDFNNNTKCHITTSYLIIFGVKTCFNLYLHAPYTYPHSHRL